MMVQKFTSMATESQYRCTRRCMLSSLSLACPPRSRSRFKGSSGGFHSVQVLQNDHHLNHRSPKGAPPLRGVFQGPGTPKRSQKMKSRWKRSKTGGRKLPMNVASGSSSSGEVSGSDSETPLAISPLSILLSEGAKGWDARRRDSRVNGADIYVARITKSGCGNARPCWRCLEWCKWAGVKRIFHWNEELNKFDVVKVNNAERDQYETHADIRLHAGLGW